MRQLHAFRTAACQPPPQCRRRRRRRRVLYRTRVAFFIDERARARIVFSANSRRRAKNARARARRFARAIKQNKREKDFYFIGKYR